MGHPLEQSGKVVKAHKAVTDGPFAEAKDLIGGYTLVQAKDLRRPRISPPGARSSRWAASSRSGRSGPCKWSLAIICFRQEAGRMVAALTRVFGIHNLALAEDVVQDAFSAARWRSGSSAAFPTIRRPG
jgi:hypothetical protein